MTKLISLILFISIIVNNCFAQNMQDNKIDKDISSYFYYNSQEFHYQLKANNVKDITSHFYYFSNRGDFLTELWYSDKIYIDKFGGFVNKNENVFSDNVSNLKSNTFPEWFIVFFIISLFILAWTNFFYSKYLVLLFKATVNFRAAQKLFNESNILTGRSAFAIIINFFLTISLTANVFLIYFDYNFQYGIVQTFLGILVFSIIIFLLKLLLNLIIGNIINKSKTAKIFNFNILIFNQILGILLLPSIIFFNYIDIEYKIYIFYIIMTFLILIYCLRIFRSFQIFFQQQFSILYLFLYLCTVEILPIYIFIRLYNNNLL